MLKAEKVTKNSKDLQTVKALYESAFPENERIDLDFIQNNSDLDSGALEMFAVYDGELFVGFVIVLSADDLSHILYFAVDEKLRSKGYGSEMEYDRNYAGYGRQLTSTEGKDKPCRACNCS